MTITTMVIASPKMNARDIQAGGLRTNSAVTHETFDGS